MSRGPDEFASSSTSPSHASAGCPASSEAALLRLAYHWPKLDLIGLTIGQNLTFIDAAWMVDDGPGIAARELSFAIDRGRGR